MVVLGILPRLTSSKIVVNTQCACFSCIIGVCFCKYTDTKRDASMESGRGAFIVLEGLDRSGKTTQTAKLVEKIEKLGRRCKLIKFPG